MSGYSPHRIPIAPIRSWKDVRFLYNRVKDRDEWWYKSTLGDHPWILERATPARIWRETFVGQIHAFAGVVGLALDKTWSCNGNPAPTANNFTSLSEVGGGLILRGLGAADNDWISLHTGDSYPFTIAVSPRLYIIADIHTTEDVYCYSGFVGVSNLAVANNVAWTVPDDGIWVEYDTSVDSHMRFVTSKDGTQTYTDIGIPPSGSSEVYISVNDAGDGVDMYLNGYKKASHTTNLPTAQLKPYSIIGRHGGAVANRDFYLKDLRIIFDLLL